MDTRANQDKAQSTNITEVLKTNNDVKECGFEFWRQKLNCAQYIVAPMVDQSELAWRMLSRRYGAQLCYTPMLHASVFIRDTRYRKESMMTCSDDRPLIVQFCANDAMTLLKAAKFVEDICEAVDLNLGCPQSIAKRGHYGAYLQDEWELLYNIVHLCAKELKVPITCKIRIFDDVERSIKFAQMLEKAGAQLLTVHGRTREQKGPLTGLADWHQISEIRKSVKIPVFANGNIQYLEDVHECIKETGVVCVMSAEGNLHNPAIFSGQILPVWQLADEYLQLVIQYPCPLSFIRGHLFKLLHHALLIHAEFRDPLGCCKSVYEFLDLVSKLRSSCQSDVNSYEQDSASANDRPVPYWLCQPYVRPDPSQPASKEKKMQREVLKRPLNALLQLDMECLSKNKLKKLRRNASRSFTQNPFKFVKCTCGNPKGLTCIFDQCRSCCRAQAYRNSVNCPGHRLKFRSQVIKQAPELSVSKSDSPCQSVSE